MDASSVVFGATQVSKTGNISAILSKQGINRALFTLREAFSVIWSYFIFKVVSDHKELIRRVSNNSSKPPPQIEWGQNCHFYFRYKAGVGNVGRHPSPQSNKSDIPATILAEEHVKCIVAHSVPRTNTIEEINQAVDSDPHFPNCLKLFLLRN